MEAKDSSIIFFDPVRQCQVPQSKTLLGELFHLHFSLGTYKQKLCIRCQRPDRFGNGHCGENMSPGTSTCYDEPMTHAGNDSGVGEVDCPSCCST